MKVYSVPLFTLYFTENELNMIYNSIHEDNYIHDVNRRTAIDIRIAIHKALKVNK